MGIYIQPLICISNSTYNSPRLGEADPNKRVYESAASIAGMLQLGEKMGGTKPRRMIQHSWHKGSCFFLSGKGHPKETQGPGRPPGKALLTTPKALRTPGTRNPKERMPSARVAS